MGLFGKKAKNKKTSETDEIVETSANATGRGKSDELSSVIDETEPEAALDLIRANTPWLLPNGQGVVLSVSTSEPRDAGGLGGLGQKSAKNDEAKGSIIKRIEADSIQVIETSDMLATNVLGLIPTPKTLGPDGIGEYTLFDSVGFYLSVAFKDPTTGALQVQPLSFEYPRYIGDDDKFVISYETARSITDGSTALSEIIPGLWAKLLEQNPQANTTEEEDPLASALAGVGFQANNDETATMPPVDTSSEPVENEDENAVPNNTDETETHTESPELNNEQPNVDNFDQLVNDSPENLIGNWQNDSEQSIETNEASNLETPETEESTKSDQKQSHETRFMIDELGNLGNSQSDGHGAPGFEKIISSHRVYDDAAVKETVARRFVNEELGLEIPMEPFEQLFGSDVLRPLAFDLSGLSEDSWLDQNIRAMAQKFNSELAAMRTQGTNILRENYISLMSRATDRITAEYSIDPSTDTVWSRSNAEIVNARDKHIEDMRTIVDKIKSEKRKQYETQRDEYAEAEKTQAKSRYEDRHRSELKRELDAIEPRLIAQIEEKFQNDRHQLIEQRRTAAQIANDALITRTLDYLIDLRADQAQAEMDRMQQFEEDLQKFLDDNRKEEMARVAVLTEQLNQHSIVEKEREKFKQRETELRDQIERERKERDEARKTSELEAKRNLERLMQDHQRQLQEAEERLKIANERTQDANARVEDQEKQTELVRRMTEQQYQLQVEMLKRNQEALEKKLEEESRSSKQMGIIVIAFVVVIALGFFAVGAIVGTFMSDGGASASAISSLIESITASWSFLSV